MVPYLIFLLFVLLQHPFFCCALNLFFFNYHANPILTAIGTYKYVASPRLLIANAHIDIDG